MKTFRFIVATLVAMLFCVACGEKENGGDNPPPQQQPGIQNFSQTDLTVSEGSGEQSFSFTANENWIISVAETKSTSWCTVFPTSGGKGAQTVKITTTENDTFDDRSVTITLKAGSDEKSFVVTQKQKNALTITSDKHEVEADGGKVTIEVKANVNYECEIEESAKSWIARAESRGLTTSTVVLSVAANDDVEKREGKVTIKSGDLKETVTIYQDGAEPSIVLTKNEFVVASAGEDIQVELRSNVAYTMIMPKGCEWIKENASRAFSSHTHFFTVSANEDYDARTASITFINKQNNLSETVTITQMQQNAILVAMNEYEFTSRGGALDFDVNANIDFSVSVDVDWITENNTRGLTTYPLHYIVAKNTVEEPREGTITITGEGLTQAIKVKQQMLISADRAVLVELYKATDGDNWTSKDNWCSDKPLSEWYGVRVKDGVVVGLTLYNNGLTGELPASLSNILTEKGSYINLSCNQLTGKIPQDILDCPWWETNWMNVLQQYGTIFEFPEGYLKVPSFKVTTLDGQQVTDEIFTKNKLTILFQWTDWDPYSPNHLPTLQTLYNAYKGSGLEILGFSCWQSEDPKGFVEENEITWPNFSADDYSFPMEMFLVPTIQVVNSEKQVVYTDYTHAFSLLPSFIIEQLGAPDLYTSTDFSRDGEVFTIQKATVGAGIDLIFMGEGFVDKDMAPGGKYEQTMKAAVDKFFEYEPYKTFRNRFNAYGIKAVSPNAEFFNGAIHAFDEDYIKAFEYAINLYGEDSPEAPCFINVIYNEGCDGRSYTTMFSTGDYVAFDMEGVNDVVVHEGCGHGFAKLADEYVEPDFENAVYNDFEGLDFWHGLDWYMNVDYNSTKEDVIWKHFMADTRYNGQVGIYEGAYTYGLGMYRPTENSMMRYNDTPFNAPSREMIYKAIMKQSEGDDWEYNYEKFVEYDAINRNAPATRSTASPADVERWKQKHRSPVIINAPRPKITGKKSDKIIIPLR